MNRRNLAAFLPIFATATASAADRKTLISQTYRFEDLLVKENGQNRSRDVLDGLTLSGFHIDLHQTELGPGMAPHASHHHAHPELLMLREGSLEVTIEGKLSTIGAGSVIYVASNEEHGWRNAGKTRASYFVIALGRV